MSHDTVVTAPERLQTWLDKPKGKRLPFSCTLAVLKAGSDIGELLDWITQSLKAGAGVKVVIDPTFRLPEPVELEVSLVLDHLHPDYNTEEGKLVRSATHPTASDITPDDNIESIAASWRQLCYTSHPFVQVNLSNLRPKDSRNSDGLLASGPLTFALVYEAIARYRTAPSMFTLLRLLGILNDVILRGGYKKGIITSACHDRSRYFAEYLNVPLVSLRGSHKKGAIISQPPSEAVRELICEKVNYESMFLQKAQPGGLYANVCMGILLEDRGTCLINRVNLGRVESIADLPTLFATATYLAIHAHLEWRLQNPERADRWADLEHDNQVAVDVMGLSNLLRRQNTSYQVFIDALDGQDNDATPLVESLALAYRYSTEMADYLCGVWGVPKMARLHTVEPAQAHSYRTTDVDGYTTCRGIWPPFSRIVNRYSHSSAEPVHTFDHGEIEALTPSEHFRLCAGWQRLMSNNGRPHSISYDTWEEFTPAVFDKWFESPLLTLYYNVTKDYNSKGYARKRYSAPELCSSCVD